MKRLVILLGILSMVFGIVAFDCSSTEMNAAKMYMADNVKQYSKAKEQLNLEIAKNSTNDEAYFLLGKIDYLEANTPNMLSNFSKALKISNKFKSEIDWHIGKTWETAFNKGIAYYNRAQKLKGDTSIATYNRALDAFQTAMVCLPDTMISYENYVYTALNLGKLDLVEAPLIKLTDKGKKAEYFTLLGKFYLDKGNKAKEANNEADSKKYYGQAITLLNNAKAKFSSDQGLMETLANAYIFSGRIEEAKVSFAEAVRVQPNNKSFRYNYGTILLNIKDFQNSEEQLKKAIELDPNYLDAIYNLAACYINQAVDMTEKATQAGQTSADSKEKVKLALPLLNKYLEKKPDDAAVWEFLAKAHTLLGNQKEAEEAYKKADQYKK